MNASKLARKMANAHMKQAGISKAYGGRDQLIDMYLPYAMVIANLDDSIRALDKSMERHVAKVREFAGTFGPATLADGIDARVEGMVARNMRDLNLSEWETVVREKAEPRAMNGHAHPNVTFSDGQVPRE